MGIQSMCSHLPFVSSIYFGLFTDTYIHQKALEALWRASFPGTELLGLVSDQWKEMGWQGKDPSTDFRSFIPSSFQHSLKKKTFAVQQTIRLIYIFGMCKHMFCWTYRGGGFISLENLLYFSRNYPVSTNYLTQLPFIFIYLTQLNISVMLDCASDIALIAIH